MEYLFNEENIKFQDCNDTIKGLVLSAQTWVYRFIKENYQLEENEFQRVLNLFQEYTFAYYKKAPGNPISGDHDRVNKVITLCSARDEPTKEELLGFLATLIHEMAHMVSKKTDKAPAIEEGLITYMERLIFDYGIKSGFPIKGLHDAQNQFITREDLENYHVGNGYWTECSIVQSFQAVCLSNGIDALPRYLFNTEGFEELKKIAREELQSKDLEYYIDVQQFKGTSDNNFLSSKEKAIIEPLIEQVDLAVIDSHLLNQNELLRKAVIKRVIELLKTEDITVIRAKYPKLPEKLLLDAQTGILRCIIDIQNTIETVGYDETVLNEKVNAAFSLVDARFENPVDLTEKVDKWFQYRKKYEDYDQISDYFGSNSIELISMLMQYDAVINNYENVEEKLKEFISHLGLDYYEDLEARLRTSFNLGLPIMRGKVASGINIDEHIKQMMIDGFKTRLQLEAMKKNLNSENVDEFLNVARTSYQESFREYGIQNYSVLLDVIGPAHKQLSVNGYMNHQSIYQSADKIRELYQSAGVPEEIQNLYDPLTQALMLELNPKEMTDEKLSELPHKLLPFISNEKLNLKATQTSNETLLSLYSYVSHLREDNIEEYLRVIGLIDQAMGSANAKNNLESVREKKISREFVVIMENRFVEGFKKDLREFATNLLKTNPFLFYAHIMPCQNVMNFLLDKGTFLVEAIKAEIRDEAILSEVDKVVKEKEATNSEIYGFSLNNAIGLSYSYSGQELKDMLELLDGKYQNAPIISLYIYDDMKKKLTDNAEYALRKEKGMDWYEIQDFLNRIEALGRSNYHSLNGPIIKAYKERVNTIHTMSDNDKSFVTLNFEPIILNIIPLIGSDESLDKAHMTVISYISETLGNLIQSESLNVNQLYSVAEKIEKILQHAYLAPGTENLITVMYNLLKATNLPEYRGMSTEASISSHNIKKKC
jgi:hypothetical protein